MLLLLSILLSVWCLFVFLFVDFSLFLSQYFSYAMISSVLGIVTLLVAFFTMLKYLADFFELGRPRTLPILLLFSMFFGGLWFVSQKHFAEKKLVGKFGHCAYLTRALYTTEAGQNMAQNIFENLSKSGKAMYFGTEKLCEFLKMEDAVADKTEAPSSESNLFIELIGIKKLSEVMQKRIDALMQAKDPSQHTFDYNRDVAQPLKEKHVDPTLNKVDEAQNWAIKQWNTASDTAVEVFNYAKSEIMSLMGEEANPSQAPKASK